MTILYSPLCLHYRFLSAQSAVTIIEKLYIYLHIVYMSEYNRKVPPPNTTYQLTTQSYIHHNYISLSTPGDAHLSAAGWLEITMGCHQPSTYHQIDCGLILALSAFSFNTVLSNKSFHPIDYPQIKATFEILGVKTFQLILYPGHQ